MKPPTQPPQPLESILHLCHPRLGTGWFRFRHPRNVLCAASLDRVRPTLTAAQQAANEGCYAVGYVSYEAAAAFDAACRTKDPDAAPLAWFAVYDEAEAIDLPPPEPAGAGLAWAPDLTPEEYRRSVALIRDYIARGHTYQANYTFRLRPVGAVDPWSVFLAMAARGAAEYAAYLDLGTHVLCSASPELFFLRDGEGILCRPMKGTAPRALTCAGDRAMAERLRTSEKDRAENVMIVDMIRNDLGRVARAGTVRVESLFDVTRYPTLFQMTSTVTAETPADVPALFEALFPCASVTGAPKIRTMEILADVETSPRGVYTGAIGVIAPRECAQFSVAIRTLQFVREEGAAQYGTGSGIVWDSVAENEYAECLTKARILQAPPPPFRLLETVRWAPDAGFLFLERHMERLRSSADYFEFRFEEDRLRRALTEAAAGWTAGPRRVRWLLSQDGCVEVQENRMEDTPFVPTPEAAPGSLSIDWARRSMDAGNVFLYHKTTHREMYEALLREHPGAADLLLWNDRGELTETCIGNVVVRSGNEWRTPPVDCGLLAGVFRAELLAQGRIREEVVRRSEVSEKDEIWRINSVRGWTRLEVSEPSIVPRID